MSIKVATESTVVNNATPLASEEVAKVQTNTTQQAEKINLVNNNLIASQLKKDIDAIVAPILRAPEEQIESNKKIDLKSDTKYHIKSFSSSRRDDENEKSIDKSEGKINDFDHKNIKDDLLVNQRHYYDESDKLAENYINLDSNTALNSYLSSPAKNKVPVKNDSKMDNFLYLQLSYQNLINQSILDKIKDTDKVDYYLGKLESLSKGVDGLKDQYQSILDDVKKYKEAYIDYWMGIYKEIKDNKLATESDINTFLKNNKIPCSITKAILSGKIKDREDMVALLNNTFSFLNLPNDMSKTSLSNIDNLHKQLGDFFNHIFDNMPNVSMDDNKLKSISSYFSELKDLIKKKENKSIHNKLTSAKNTYRDLIATQSKIELEIMANSLSGMALLTYLLAKVRELTMKVMLQRSDSEQKLFDQMREVTEKSLKDKVEDQKAQIKKQEEIKYWAGIGLKILGGLLSLIAGVAAIFTAGSSMALLGVAVALFAADVGLTVADEVYQAVHNKSFMDEIMASVSEAINNMVDEIVTFLVNTVNTSLDFLKKLGLDADIDKIKNQIQDKLKLALKILVTAALFIGAIALTLVLGPLAQGISKGVSNITKRIFNEQVKQTLKKVLNDYLEKTLGKFIKEILNKIYDDVMKSLNKFLAKELSEKANVMLKRTLVTSKMVNTLASSTVNIYSSTLSAKLLESVGNSKKLEAILDLIINLMNKIMESYNENVDTITDILKNMSDKLSESSKLKSNIIKNISI